MVVRQMVVDAVLLEGRSVREVARSFGVSKSFVAKLVQRYGEGGAEALAPRSRAPRSVPRRTPDDVEDLVVELRKELSDLGADAGPLTIRHHLAQHLDVVPSRATIHRILVRRGFVTPQPRKRPRSSFVRFEADQPNERWQADVTHWHLADGRDVEILTFIDDHSRFVVACTARPVVKSEDVVGSFLKACERFGEPASVLTDNGAIFNAISRKGATHFETLLAERGIDYRHSRPYHPQTCGKVERWHLTLKGFLAKRDAVRHVGYLQRQLDHIVAYYNDVRPHRARGMTPHDAFLARERAKPQGVARRRYRVRHDHVDAKGKVSLRYRGRMLHVNVGLRLQGKSVILHVIDDEVRVLDVRYRLLGEATLDPSQSYQPMRKAE